MLDTPFFGRSPILCLLCGVLSSAPAAAQDGTALRTTVFRGAEIAYEVIDGLAIYDGDIILGTAEEVAGWGAEWSPQTGGLPPISRAAPPGRRQNGAPCLWPGGIIPYVIDDDVPGRDRILRAIREWDTKTILRFVERTSQQDYLHYTLGSVSGAWLCAGDSPGNVVIQIGPGGSSYEVILHGIGHALGWAHEQQRRDRDRWVTVFSENIAATPYAQGNWHPDVGLGVDTGPYDYRSIMTYQAFDHNKRRNHARTLLMETIPPGIPFGGEAMGELSELSPGDIDSVARLYGHVPTEHVIATNPPGLDVIVDGERMTAPVSFTWEIGSKHTLEMPSPQFRPGSRFLFGRWSDDGARAHTITATRDTTLYYANFIAQHRVTTGVDVSCRTATTCAPDDGRVTVTPSSPDGYYTLRTPIEVTATPTPGSDVRFLRWAVDGDHWWSWYWTRMHGGGSNPARTRVGPGLAYRAQFVDGPIFRVDSNVDPVQVFVGDWWGETPAMFRVEEFSGTTTVSPRLIERRGKGYRHRFRSWSDGGEMTHTVEVPQDADSTLTLTLDTEYRLNTSAWQEWFGNRIETVPASADGFYAEGTVVRLRASAKAPAEFLGWNGGVSGRDPTAVVVMDDGQLAEAAFNLDAIELQSGVPAHVSLRWQGTDLEYHELDSERYYLQVPPDASELQIQFDSLSATPGAAAGLWVAAQDLWPGWVKGSETADLILGDGVARVTIPRPPDRWPAAYTILVRAAESTNSQVQTLEGTLVATVSRDANPNRPPQAVGTLEDQTLTRGGPALVLDVARAFADPDGDLLTYAAVSSSPGVAAVALAGSRLTVTPVNPGSATVTVTATDPGGASATQAFRVSVATGAAEAFTDDPIRPGTTPIKAVHFIELRERIDALRARDGLPAFRWTDPTLVAGVTPVKRVHLTELRSALDAVYDAAGRPRPAYADADVAAGATSIKAAHVMELRTAVLAAE